MTPEDRHCSAQRKGNARGWRGARGRADVLEQKSARANGAPAIVLGVLGMLRIERITPAQASTHARRTMQEHDNAIMSVLQVEAVNDTTRLQPEQMRRHCVATRYAHRFSMGKPPQLPVPSSQLCLGMSRFWLHPAPLQIMKSGRAFRSIPETQYVFNSTLVRGTLPVAALITSLRCSGPRLVPFANNAWGSCSLRSPPGGPRIPMSPG